MSKKKSYSTAFVKKSNCFPFVLLSKSRQRRQFSDIPDTNEHFLEQKS